ncbi:6-phosphofructokinase [Chishuiella changwenlii]|uniref:ATP-dependent 6-phosphofructokinase n=1 Tax=Chishuiella changwenlii TaxID=1434701 RepID=A0A1M7C1M0_9FLAO|nr:6-phosphofructokinase [Chishuiella changwenlii]GGF05854.1 ATP-dependent 6-phosphofructokinase [Chishuiella changwenlii]SHL61188.1 6-phosphofructokinase [Chishuiella changwenlii]
MGKNIKRIGVLTSGGDAPGMNAALRAVVRACKYYQIESIGIRQGYEGLINNDMIELGPRSVKNIINQGGTILKTARSTEFRTPEGRKKAYEHLQKNNLDALVVIGGDGSFTGANIFHKEYNVPFIGIPGTIDNDIFGTDFTIGYDTALNTVVEAVDKLRDTATSHDRVFFVEVMGRDAGFIALNSGIASGAQDILIPEQRDSVEDLCDSLERSEESGKKSSIVIIAEGEQLGGVYEIAKQVKARHQEYDIRVTVLGHIQRGGSPTCHDRVLASRLGIAAVEGLLEGKTNLMAGIRSNKIVFTPIDEAIIKHNEIDTELIKVANILAI